MVHALQIDNPAARVSVSFRGSFVWHEELPENAAAVLGMDVRQPPCAVVGDPAERLHSQPHEFRGRLVDIGHFNRYVVQTGSTFVEVLLDEAPGSRRGDNFELDAGSPDLADAAAETVLGVGFPVVQKLETQEPLQPGGLILPACGGHTDVVDALDRQQIVLQGRGCAGYGKLRPKVPAMTAIERATVMLNPNARGVPASFDAARVVSYLGRRGVEARLVVPSSAEMARTEAAKAADRGDHALFAIGGDGSLREAAAGLAGSDTALAAIRGGTVNIFAREAGIPAGIRRALDAHLDGQTVRMDLGRGDGHYFLLMAGVGWDAEIVRRVSSGLKRRLGDIAYLAQGAWMLPGLRPRNAAWHYNGEQLHAPLALMILGNTRLYGGRIDLTPRAFADDGFLDLVALCPERLGDGARLALKVAAGRLSGDGHVIERRIRHVAIDTPGLAVQFDGDFAGETPMEFEIAHRVLAVRVPPGPLPAIFSESQAQQPVPAPARREAYR